MAESSPAVGTSSSTETPTKVEPELQVSKESDKIEITGNSLIPLDDPYDDNNDALVTMDTDESGTKSDVKAAKPKQYARKTFHGDRTVEAYQRMYLMSQLLSAHREADSTSESDEKL